MAGETTTTTETTPRGSDVRELIKQHNKLVDDLETLRAAHAALLAKLDADGGVTDADYAATAAIAVPAAELTAAKIGNNAGVAITT